MSVRKICVIGLHNCGVPLGAVIAVKCPEIRVTVVQKNSAFAFQLNTGQIPSEIFVPGLEELSRKCQNKNLVFTTNEKSAIKEADFIFIMSHSKLKTCGEGKKQAVDLSGIVEVARLIAEESESNKIVVENSSIPLKTAECVRYILKRYGKPKIEFEVLSNPSFYEHGNPIRTLLNLEYVLIGSENTPKGLDAARQLANIYERWLPSENIIIKDIWTAELSKICVSAMTAQLYSTLQAISCICEKTGGSVSVCRDVILKKKNLEADAVNSCFFFNVGQLPLAIHNLVYLYESYDCTETADYWRGVLEMFNFNKTKFFRDILHKMNETLASKRVVLFGFAYYKDTEVTEGSFAIDVCKWLLEENSFVNVYDIKISKNLLIEAVVNSGCKTSVEDIKKFLTVFDDPYKASEGSQVIILCCTWPEFTQLNFTKIFEVMKKPAYIFDTALILPHSQLTKIGFQVYPF